MKNLIYFAPCLCVLVFIFFVSGCDQQRHHTKKTTQTVKVYKQHNPKHVVNSAIGDEWVYWYIMMYNNNYYYYSSPSYVTPQGYSSFAWTQSKTEPIPAEEMNNPQEVQPVATAEVPNEALGQQMETSIDTTEAQISDMISEGNPNNSESVSESSSGSDSSSSSSDSGSSGGDSGGGGGGGGE